MSELYSPTPNQVPSHDVLNETERVVASGSSVLAALALAAVGADTDLARNSPVIPRVPDGQAGVIDLSRFRRADLPGPDSYKHAA